eukprot:CFRG1455T1
MGNICGKQKEQLDPSIHTWLPTDISWDDEANCPIERVVYINESEKNELFNYKNNYVSTAKYTILTFLPMNLFEQFQRLANAYFLFLLVLQCIPGVSSLDPMATLVPLLFVISLTCIKDANDDVKRHRSDNDVNGREVERFCQFDKKWQLIRWDEISVGDIIRIEDKDPVAADVLILLTSEPGNECFSDTAELDGESNLKRLYGLKATDYMTSETDIAECQACVVCEPPNPNLNSFNGRLLMKSEVYAIDKENVLLRGMTMRNTKWAVAVVFFAGGDTKLMCNSIGARFKRTRIDEQMNLLIIYIFIILLLLSLGSAIGTYVWEVMTGEDFQLYLPAGDVENPILIACMSFLSYIILYNTLVPISLYVSVEIIRLGQSWLIDWDLRMYHPPSDTPAHARTTTLTEELGQIGYVFSDKTGTLTQNIMAFMKCSINGKKYGKGLTDANAGAAARDGKSVTDMQQLEEVDFSWNPYADAKFKFYDQSLVDVLASKGHDESYFFRCLALCHSVQADTADKNQIPVYNAQSPDEAALVKAAMNFGFVFKKRTREHLFIQVNGKIEKYKLLALLDFTSDRKRMTVVLEWTDGRIRVITKGADSVMFARINCTQEQLDNTEKHLEEYATDGLRTLVFGDRTLEMAWYTDWAARYKTASQSIDERDEKVAEMAEEIETQLALVGTTAIEDKLQLGVPAAISRLRQASIRVWVLTGDKQQTAINIGFACQLLTNQMQIFTINEITEDAVYERLQILLDKVAQDDGPKALVIDGASLAFALSGLCALDFLEVGKTCQSVICCRVSPLQKADVVRLVKSNTNLATLAIGDGANDVSMIQAAHIGVGISGLEGRQAVLASDFSIAQFRFLERLLLVHGRWSYIRMTKFLTYFFYKNFALTLIQLWYSFFTGFSAQTAFESWFISFFNLVFTSLPVLAMGIFEQDVGQRYCLKYAELYALGTRNKLFNHKIFFLSLGQGVWHSAAIFFIGTFSLPDSMQVLDGWSTGLEWNGVAMAWAVILVVTMVMAIDTWRWTVWNHMFIIGSLIAWWVFSFYMYGMPIFITGYASYFGTIYYIPLTPGFWAYQLLIVAVCILPLLLYRFWQQMYHPISIDVAREVAWMNRSAYRKKKEEPFPTRRDSAIDQRRKDLRKKNLLVEDSMTESGQHIELIRTDRSRAEDVSDKIDS